MNIILLVILFCLLCIGSEFMVMVYFSVLLFIVVFCVMCVLVGSGGRWKFLLVMVGVLVVVLLVVKVVEVLSVSVVSRVSERVWCMEVFWWRKFWIVVVGVCW